jgi:hypothetical protein
MVQARRLKGDNVVLYYLLLLKIEAAAADFVAEVAAQEKPRIGPRVITMQPATMAY